jgi:hypothetical protein
LNNVQLAFTKKHRVIQITIDFSGPVNAGQADSLAIYHLTVAGKRRSFTGKGTKSVTLNRAVYSESTASVTLRPKKPFLLSKLVQLRVSGLTDALGRFIDGNHNGQAGGDAVAILSKRGVSIVVSPQRGPLLRLSVRAVDHLMSSESSSGALGRTALSAAGIVVPAVDIIGPGWVDPESGHAMAALDGVEIKLRGDSWSGRGRLRPAWWSTRRLAQFSL